MFSEFFLNCLNTKVLVFVICLQTCVLFNIMVRHEIQTQEVQFWYKITVFKDSADSKMPHNGFYPLESYHSCNYINFHHNDHKVNSTDAAVTLQSNPPRMCSCMHLTGPMQPFAATQHQPARPAYHRQ